MTSSSSNEVRKRSMKTIFSAVHAHLIDSFHQLNLFADDPVWSSSLTYSKQIVNTRLFLVFMSISMLIVIVYSSLIVVKRDVTLHSFSLGKFEGLESLHPNTIDSSCREVSIPYGKFLYLSPVFHEVCSSEFIEERWISSLFMFNATSHNILDYRTFAFAHYRALALLCNVSRQAVNDARRTFNATHLVNRHIFSRMQFKELSSVLFHNIKRNILTNEKRTGNIISMITAHNHLWSALRTNFYMRSVPGSRFYRTYSRTYPGHDKTGNSTCDCSSKGDQCIYPSGGFYNWSQTQLDMPVQTDPPPLFQVSGLMAGCFSLDSMRHSTLECLYNQTCIDLIAFQPHLSHPKALNISLSRFPVNSTIGSIFDESLFVESWQNHSSFENYFAACAPQSLSYSDQGRVHLETIIHLTLSAFSGLVIILKLLTPIFEKTFHLLTSKQQPTQSSSPSEQTTPKSTISAVVSHLHQTISNFNLFPSENKNDLEVKRIGIISTRFCILITCISLIVLSLYTGLAEHDYTHMVKNPSLRKFQELHSQYSSKLDCPCSSFSMSYGRMILSSARYHSICSSDYLKDFWLSYFNRTEVHFMTTDFRYSGLSFFNLLKIFCQASAETIDHAISVFKTNRFVTMNALSEQQFSIEIQTRLEWFQKQTISSFVHLIQTMRSILHTNQIAEELFINIGPFSIQNNDTLAWSLRFRPRNFYTNSCSCILTNECTRLVGFSVQIINTSHTKPNIPIPGLVLACYAMDSVLLSTLECFYSSNCIKTLIDNYDFDAVGLLGSLDDRALQIQPLTTENSRFLPNATINDIFSQSFVEEWINSTNYTSYYTRCQPAQCTYTERKRFHVAYMFAIILGFYGGLSAILDILLPPLIRLIAQHRKKSTRESPVVTDPPNNSATNPVKESVSSSNVLFQKPWTLNLFKEYSSSTEKQIVASRIYVLLLIFSMIFVLLYYGPLSKETTPVVEKHPSIETMNDLYRRNISRLSCSCSKAAIPYSDFLSIQVKFYPICSSDVVSLSYRSQLYERNNSNSTSELVTHYRILSTLCQLSKQFLTNALKVFENRELITVEPLSNATFSGQIESRVINFIRRTKSDYRRILHFITQSFHVNQLVTLFMKNWKIEFTDEEQNHIFKSVPSRFASSNCTCAISSDCRENLTNSIRVGCFPYDGFRFSKFGKLNQQLFVQNWSHQANYSNYFQTCRPLECQYTVSNKNNVLFMLTSLLGLYGGLSYFLYFIVGQGLLAYQWWVQPVS